jgi:hypothetical protein
VKPSSLYGSDETHRQQLTSECKDFIKPLYGPDYADWLFKSVLWLFMFTSVLEIEG